MVSVILQILNVFACEVHCLHAKFTSILCLDTDNIIGLAMLLSWLRQHMRYIVNY